MDRPTTSGSAAVERVRAALADHGVDLAVKEFAESTATAADAAAAIGTTVGRIVKSLVFMVRDEPVLVLASGPNRVDLDRLSRLVGGAVQRANAQQVRAHTGFAIGGVPPVGHTRRLKTYIDADLLLYDEVWAAAGTPNSVFSVAPDELVRMTDGQVVDVAQQA